MKIVSPKIVSLATFLCLLLCCAHASLAEVLTNRSVERMVAAGLSPEIITSKIQTTQSNFDVSIDSILELKKKGIHDDIIKAMVEASSTKAPAAPPQGSYEGGGQYYEPGQYTPQQQPYYSQMPYQPRPQMDPVAKLRKDIAEAQALKDKRDYTWKSKVHSIAVTLKSIYPGNTHNIKYWWAYVEYSVLVEKEHHISKGLKKVLYFDPYDIEALILMGDTDFAHARRLRPGDDESAGLSREDMEREARKAYQSALDVPRITPEQRARVYYQLGEMTKEFSMNKDKAKRKWQQAIDAAPGSQWADKARERLGIPKEIVASDQGLFEPVPPAPSLGGGVEISQ